MTVNTAAGAKLYIGGAGTPANLAAFQAESYIEVGEVEDLGQVGDESDEIRFASLADGRWRKFKGPRDAGTMAIIVGADLTDAGQDAMIAAEAEILDYAFKVELNDQVTLSGTPTIIFCYGKVMSQRFNIGNVSNVVRRAMSVGVNSPLTIVDPS